ncbi:MAG: DNA repair putative endonuclease MmcB [Pseudomonadota bacterium]
MNPSHAHAPLARAENPAIDDARALTRGAARLLLDLGLPAVPEFTLPCGRRADLAGLGPKGEIVIVEVKSGAADFRADEKWPEYFAWCDRFYFAVSDRFPRQLLPEDAGLIIADAFGAGVVRECPHRPLAPARRKALTLRFARNAAQRVTAGL